MLPQIEEEARLHIPSLPNFNTDYADDDILNADQLYNLLAFNTPRLLRHTRK